MGQMYLQCEHMKRGNYTEAYSILSRTISLPDCAEPQRRIRRLCQWGEVLVLGRPVSYCLLGYLIACHSMIIWVAFIVQTTFDFF